MHSDTATHPVYTQAKASVTVPQKAKHSYAILQDWKANKGNIKGRLVMIAFRIAHVATANKALHVLLVPYLVFYKVFVMWIMTVELQHRVKIGRNLKLSHGQGLVVHKSTIIGSNCTLRQNTTIGNKRDANGNKKAGAIIGDNVDVGCHTCIIGNITIGSNTVVGAGSIIVKSVPEKVVVAGNPARILKHL